MLGSGLSSAAMVVVEGRRGRSGDHRVMKCFVGFFVAERHQSRLPSVVT